MAKQAQSTDAASPESASLYEPERIYDVRLSRAVKVGRATIKPMGVHQMTGAALIDIVAREGEDAIVSAQPK